MMIDVLNQFFQLFLCVCVSGLILFCFCVWAVFMLGHRHAAKNPSFCSHPIGFKHPTHDPSLRSFLRKGGCGVGSKGMGVINRVIVLTPISRVVVTPSYPIIGPCIGVITTLVGAHLVANHSS